MTTTIEKLDAVLAKVNKKGYPWNDEVIDFLRDHGPELRAALVATKWQPIETRPADGQLIAYFFEPFQWTYIGRYDAENDSVIGRSGFTSVIPEVPWWMPQTLPALPVVGGE